MEITNGLFDLHNVSPRGNKAAGGLRLYILLLINMWSVCGQWRRGFACTIKTDATFYLLNGREAERVALDHAAACCWRVMTSSFHRLLRWMATRERACSFFSGMWGRDELVEVPQRHFFFPQQPFFVFVCSSWINRPRGEENLVLSWSYSWQQTGEHLNTPTGLSVITSDIWYLANKVDLNIALATRTRWSSIKDE